MSSKKLLTPGRIGFLAALAAGYTRLVGRTSRWAIRGDEPVRDLLQAGSNVIFAFWHNRFTLMPYFCCRYFKKTRVAVIVSQSRDGELVGRMIGKFGLRAIRGSTTRGGKEALVNLARGIKEGWDAAVTPDGPQGPRYQVQDGIISLASITGAPIIPVSCASSHQVVLRRSWDHMRLPLPFGRITMVFSDPIPVKKRLPRPERIRLARELQDRLSKADREAEAGTS